jgi:hypothetical protein
MSHAFALVRQCRLPEWAAEDALRTLVVAFCALALALAGHLPAL